MSASPLSLEMQVLLGPVEYVDLPNAPILISVATPVACKKGVGKFPLMPGNRNKLKQSAG